MIDLYTWSTPNGYKVSIALEELALAYEVHPVNIMAGEQFAPAFLEISPNNRIPAIVDRDGPGGKPLSIFESGAILVYLAEKAGSLLPKDARGRAKTLEWLMFQMGGIGPMFGQSGHFRMYAKEKIPYAIERYTNEAKRLLGVLDRALANRAHVAGDELSIADIAIYPWLLAPDRQGVDINEFPNVLRWRSALAVRPSFQKGILVPPRLENAPPMDAKAHDLLFGAGQFEKRKV